MTFQMESGAFLQEAPVLCVELDVRELAVALEKAQEFGNPTMPTPDFKKRRDPMLYATGARSWKEMGRNGKSYGIFWHRDKVELYMSKLDNRGRFVHDPDKTQIFYANISMEEIAKAIIEDVHPCS